MNAEEEACLIEEESLKSEEEQEVLWLKAEEESWLAEEERLKAQEEQQAQLKAGEEACLAK